MSTITEQRLGAKCYALVALYSPGQQSCEHYKKGDTKGVGMGTIDEKLEHWSLHTFVEQKTFCSTVDKESGLLNMRQLQVLGMC